MDDVFFMNAALKEAEDALLAGEFPVGCIITHGSRVVASGARTATRAGRVNEVDHAEIIAIRKMSEISGAEGLPAGEMTLFSTMEPCLMCYSAIMLAGIGRIVYAYEDAMGGGTSCRLDSLPPLYGQRKPVIIPGVLRKESLALFKSFFSNPDNGYWKDSLLEKYTMAQP